MTPRGQFLPEKAFVNAKDCCSTGRYIESDPIGLAGGPSTYSYALSQPHGLVDPLGLSTFTYEPTEQSRAGERIMGDRDFTFQSISIRAFYKIYTRPELVVDKT